jgi:4-amino-4-deoxy-L-arabinose transferase-like glycosyltransferase
MTWHTFRFYRELGRWDRFFLLVLCVSVVFRLVFIDVPPLRASCEPAQCVGPWDLGLVFDEAYFVNAVRNIIGRPMAFGYADRPIADVYPKFTDPYPGHPPLAKLIVALSALVLGENAFAYRLPSVIFGTLLLLSLYLAVKRLASDQVAFYAATFLSLDTLTLIHSRIFTLDIFMVSFMVLGFYLFLRGRYVAAGMAIGLSALSKEMGVIGIAIIMTFLAVERVSKRTFITKESAVLAAKVLLGLAVPVVLLSALMLIWWQTTPWQNIARLGLYMVDHYNLDGSYVAVGSNSSTFGIICPPWLWILNRNVIEYYSGTVSGLTVNYVGEMNPMLIYMMLPGLAFSAWSYWRTRARLGLFGLVWWSWTYLITYPMAFAGRTMYIFYMLPTMGAISIMVASMTCHRSINPYVRSLYLSCLLVMMILQFPIKLLPF